jgi:sugar transferase (PEP-CTERM system associated)
MARGVIADVTWRSTALMLAETVLIVSAIGIGARLVLGNDAWEVTQINSGFPKALLICIVCQLCLYYGDLYGNPRLSVDDRELLLRMLQALGATSLILSALYYLFPNLSIDHDVFVISAALVALAIVGWRLGVGWMLARVVPRERLLMVGTSGAGMGLARELQGRRELGVEVVGFVDANAADAAALARDGHEVIGAIEDIPSIVRARSIDTVVLSMTDVRGKLPMDALLDMRLEGVTFEHLASVYETYTGKIALEQLRPSWFLFSPGFSRSSWKEVVKRGVDIIAAVSGGLLVAPAMIVLAALVKLTSRGPALYSQQRVGLQGRPFTVYKFRSMVTDAEAKTGAVWARAGDPRITKIGRFMRRTRLDELPQLWNILRGDMSLVGPRPERPEFVKKLAEEIPFYGQRHVVKPGLSGWAQVRYTYGASIEDSLEKLQFDLYYIKNFSLSLDFFIIFETIKTVILRRGA